MGNPGIAQGRLSVLPTDLLYSPVAAAEELYNVIASRYDVTRSSVDIGSEPLEVLLVRDTNKLLEQVSPVLFAEDERLPYWADLWTSAIDLAAWVAEGQNLAGRRLLELGTGLGLAGIAAARSGASVTLTDYETDALLFARYNALSNLSEEIVRQRVRCVPVDWRAPDIGGKFDVIIGADIVYDRKNFDPILTLLQSHLAPGGGALLTEPDRAIGQAFLAAARDYPFTVETGYSPVVRDGKMYRITRIMMRHGKTGTARPRHHP